MVEHMLLIFPNMRNPVEKIEGQHASRLTQMPQDGRLTPGAAWCGRGRGRACASFWDAEMWF